MPLHSSHTVRRCPPGPALCELGVSTRAPTANPTLPALVHRRASYDRTPALLQAEGCNRRSWFWCSGRPHEPATARIVKADSVVKRGPVVHSTLLHLGYD